MSCFPNHQPTPLKKPLCGITGPLNVHKRPQLDGYKEIIFLLTSWYLIDKVRAQWCWACVCLSWMYKARNHFCLCTHILNLGEDTDNCNQILPQYQECYVSYQAMTVNNMDPSSSSVNQLQLEAISLWWLRCGRVNWTKRQHDSNKTYSWSKSYQIHGFAFIRFSAIS